MHTEVQEMALGTRCCLTQGRGGAGGRRDLELEVAFMKMTGGSEGEGMRLKGGNRSLGICFTDPASVKETEVSSRGESPNAMSSFQNKKERENILIRKRGTD